MKSNEYIEEFLESYIADDTYNYAIMINGAWGSGKTFFVRNYVGSHTKKEKFLYVSLYGVKEIEEISKDIYAQILKKNSLYNKTIGKFEGKKGTILGNIGGRIASDLCKSKGIDVDGIKKIYEELVELNNYIFIFDDLERSSIGMNEILGYINNLVEHSEIKAIIIANEPKIADKSYKEIKEKLIANTIMYEPNVEPIFKVLIKELQENEMLKKSLINNIDIFNKKSNKNIRTYQFFISKYRRAYRKLLEMYNGKIDDGLIKKIIEEMYESVIVYKSGEDDLQRNLEFISNYIYLDKWEEDEIKKHCDLYLNQMEENKSKWQLNELECWEFYEDDKVISLLKGIVDDLHDDKYDIKYFAKIIRVALIVTDKGFDKKYLDNIINEMKKKDYNSSDLKDRSPLCNGYFSSDNEKNKELSSKYKRIVDDVVSTLNYNSSKSCCVEVNNLLKSDNWIEELKKYLNEKETLGDENVFSLCELNILVEKIKELNNDKLYNLRTVFREATFSKQDQKFLEFLKKEMQNILIEEKKIIKKNVLEYFIGDIDYKLRGIRCI